jgi:hypothetical protein
MAKRDICADAYYSSAAPTGAPVQKRHRRKGADPRSDRGEQYVDPVLGVTDHREDESMYQMLLQVTAVHLTVVAAFQNLTVIPT